MSHGAPDDSDVVKRGDVYRLDDMAELAARLGSPVAYHRYGDVIWFDTFVGGLGGWSYSVAVPDSNVYVQSDHYLRDGIAAELFTQAVTLSHPWLYKRAAYYPDTLIGFGVQFLFDGGDIDLFLTVQLFTGTNRYSAEVQIQFPAGALLYLNSAGIWVPFGNVGTLDVDGYIWTPIKMVVDTSAHQYIKFMFGLTTFLLPAVAMYAAVDTTAAHSLAGIGFGSDDVYAQSLYIDDAVFTCNEEV